jgi:hypothetical protein
MIDTVNSFAVGVRENRIVILAFGRTLTVEQAYNLAAWLVVQAEIVAEHEPGVSGETDFDAWLNAVRST